MKHASSDMLDKLEPLLLDLRKLGGLEERGVPFSSDSQRL